MDLLQRTRPGCGQGGPHSSEICRRPLWTTHSHSSSSSQSAGCDARCGVACECESRIPPIWEENGKTRKKQQLPFRWRGGRFIQRDRGSQSPLAPALAVFSKTFLYPNAVLEDMFVLNAIIFVTYLMKWNLSGAWKWYGKHCDAGATAMLDIEAQAGSNILRLFPVDMCMPYIRVSSE